MASPTTTLLFLTIITIVFATSATARPCKTIFFITSFQNPNNPSPRFTLLITQTHTHTRPLLINPTVNPSFSSSSKPNDVVSSISKQSKPYTSSSFGDRTMDIMSVVGALLFGAGCGALTAATMYLIWSLCSNNRGLEFASDYSDDDDVEDVEDDVSNKKNNGYVAVPATDAVKDVPPTADEVDAMKH